jgi:hypothetical protein
VNYEGINMPLKKGTKLIARKSHSGKYTSIRALVFALFNKKPTITKKEMEKILKDEYPTSNFFSSNGKGGHFTWYKHKWNKDKLENERFTLKKIRKKELEHVKRHESQKTQSRGTHDVGAKTVGKSSDRAEN